MKNVLKVFVCYLAMHPLMAQDLENLGEITERQFLQIKGSLTLGMNYYYSTADRAQQNPFNYILSGAPIISVYGFDIPLSFTFANESFAVAGPNTDIFDRYGMSPYYKWVTVHAGYRNVAFSPYTLNNHNFLGGGFELEPGKWRVGFVYGRFREAIEEDTTAEGAIPPSYRRFGYAAKLGYGDNNNYIEFSFLKAEDDENSIETPLQTDLPPQENLVLGLSGKATLWKKFILAGNFGASAYTEDTRAAEIAGFENFPLNLSGLYQPRASSRINFAGDISLAYQQSWYSIKAEFMQIDPEYETMGSYFFNNDLRRYTLAPSFTFWQGRLNLGGSFGLQRDNLLGDKAATTRRFINSAFMQVTPAPQFTLAAQYGNYATQQSSGLVSINDTIRVFQVNHNISVTPSYYISGEVFMQTFVLSLSRQMLQDQNDFTENLTESQTNNANFNYQLTNNPLGYTLTAGLNYLDLAAATQDVQRYGFTLGANKTLWSEKIKIGLTGMYNLSSADGESDGYIFTTNFNFSFIPVPAHAFVIRGQSIANNTSFKYNDYMLSANYTFSF